LALGEVDGILAPQLLQRDDGGGLGQGKKS
jgi:hypothetical protein